MALGSSEMGNKIESPDGSPLALRQPVLKAREVGDLVDGRVALQRAREQARRLLAEAKQLRDEARQKGYEEGLEAGNRESAARMIGLISGSVKYLAEREREVAAVVVATVTRVLGELDHDALILHSVRNALVGLRSQQNVTVRAAPSNANTLLDGLPHDYPEVEVLSVVADERLSGDECVIETDIGIVNINRNDFVSALKKRIGERLGISMQQLDDEIARLGGTGRCAVDSAAQPHATATPAAETAPDFSNLELEPLR